ncbi:glycerophosphocholine phosphodiesterase GPCPD1-like [Branchiostoma floridae]|uniref:Glycerophosphocholine phosphodiesterase GPCPD1-like n=1 Tax=Branchiostoma floridae TaxID=7739 RepID=A0A9J7MZ68_BRAFL|nr:glycerophosphocholine phosphodiesterase GPCPD1-like [Branchiostoma floridae]
MTSQVTFRVKVAVSDRHCVVVVGDCPSLGGWDPHKAVELQREENDVWSCTVPLPEGTPVRYRYMVCDIRQDKTQKKLRIIKWETYRQPRTFTPNGKSCVADGGSFGSYDGSGCAVDQGWLVDETEIRLRFHSSKSPPIIIFNQENVNRKFFIKVMPINIQNLQKQTVDGKYNSPTCEETPVTCKVLNDTQWCPVFQDQWGHLLENDNYLIFTTQVFNPQEWAFDILLYAESEISDAQSNSHTPPVAKATVLPTNMTGSTGVVSAPLHNNHNRLVGQINVDYLIITPMTGEVCTAEVSFARYWKKRKTLDVGHRGMGNSYTAASVAHIRENTIASFLSAANHGAAFVEFDVQLTKDKVPIVYHDYKTCISTKTKGVTGGSQLMEIAVMELTLEDVQSLKLDHKTAKKLPAEKEASIDDEEPPDLHPFPTLRKVCSTLPEHVNLNIEVKFPLLQQDGAWEEEMDTYFDRNEIVDIIMREVLENGGKRRILLSSFDADCCVLLRRKQNKYPVLFLSQGVTERWEEMMDVRCRTVPMAMNFTLAEGLLGVDIHAEDILRNPSFVEEIAKLKLVCFVWGEDINDPANMSQLRSMEVDGIIYDRMSDHREPGLYQFETEKQNGPFLAGISQHTHH